MKGSDASMFTITVKRQIRDRQAKRCAYCGMPCTIAHFHHRKPRRMGGSVDPALGRASNGLMLHPRCHQHVEADREWALANGYLLRDGDDPQEVPVVTWQGPRLLVGADLLPVPADKAEVGDVLGVFEVPPVPPGEGG